MAEFKCRKSETLRRQEEERQDDTKREEEEEEVPGAGGDEDDVREEESSRAPSSKQSCAAVGFLQVLVRGFFGVLAAVACGMLYAAYLSAYHDRKFWFSTRQELQRELSFQGGSGFYFHFFKRMSAAPSFDRGFSELLLDNRTVSGETLNAVERLFLYPELISSFIYRATGCQDYVEPVYFYIGTVLGLQAFYVTALFVCSWVLSGTWVSGLLAVSWYLINRQDTTRVDQAVPLRANWALPYFSCQVAALTGFLSNTGSAAEMFCYLTMSVSTFTFLLLWEHAHYVLFVQGLCVLLLDSLDLVPPRKVTSDHCGGGVGRKEAPGHLNASPESPVDGLQGGQQTDCQDQDVEGQNRGLGQPQEQVLTRRLEPVLAQQEVEPLDVWTVSELKVFPLLSGQPISTDLRLEDGRIGERPAVVYHVFHMLLFGFLTLLFDGVKYVWTPYVCMFTAFGVCSPDLWMTVFRWLRLKSVHPVVLSLILSTAVPTIIGFSLWREYYPRVLAELADLQEFDEPDTVELISWIRSQVPAAAVLAASPQLLGTLKLCSGSVVTSLPVYTDLDLLRRTEDTYQVYAMRSAEDVYKRLTAHKTNYVIVEESICNELTVRKNCRVKDLLDVSNHHVVYDRGGTHSSSKHGRFCQEVKMNYSPYTNYFTRVFWNRSYHVYRVNAVVSFQF
ncbi:probable C-mannosyltransferase DPY19L4 [Nematolebias whitei]|uniref:probable C-mannosyltransferase DPY19L4 n=1 Tax=Nematolebias whitei TaxID=451745 RepID=UPI0018977114|nr:probable C-mannosyltransferase DPY19L4 [Nematolebias whitei]